MIRRCLVVSLTLIAAYGSPGGLSAVDSGGGTITSQTAQRHGLERVWFSQMRVNPSRGETVHLQLHVSQVNSQTVFRITDQFGRTEEISDRHLDTFGRVRGVDGAQLAAAERVRLLQLRGVEATVEQRVVPDITLYVTGSRGVVHAMDAETGEARWVTPVGRSVFPTTSVAANDEFVAVINGQHMYVLRADNGMPVTERRIVGGTPASGPAMMGSTLFVPTLSGRLLAFAFGPEDNAWPEVYYSRGTVRFPPTVVSDRVLWPTDKGVVTSIVAGQPGILFRLQFDGAIAGPLVYSPPGQMLLVTQPGYLYSFDIKTGKIFWRFSTGDEMAEPASVVDDVAYLMSRHAGMYAVATTTGLEKWSAPAARRFIAATPERVYATTTTGRVLVLDAESGRLVSQIPVDPRDQVFTNNQTDRLYVGTRTGLIQCFREVGARWPTVHVTGGEMAAADADRATRSETGQPGREPAPAPRDPFAPEPPADAEPEMDESDDSAVPDMDDEDPFGS